MFRDSILQSTSSQTSTTTLTVFLIWTPFLLGWVIALLLLGAGRFGKRPRLFLVGVIVIGIMTVITPLGLYLYQTIAVDGGVFEATPLDFLLLSLLSTLGGGILTLGLARFVQYGRPKTG